MPRLRRLLEEPLIFNAVVPVNVPAKETLSVDAVPSVAVERTETARVEEAAARTTSASALLNSAPWPDMLAVALAVA
jgi:hypothetical protein|tara:strand:- start:108 stop:338 length:231 start_codon:yes stop_codon:yes gene_type:complete